MTNAAPPARPEHREPILARLDRAPGRWWYALAEAVASARGVGLAFLGLAAFLGASPWLRPPLSPDVSAMAVPAVAAAGASDSSLLDRPADQRLDSVGVAVVAVAALGALVVFWDPAWTGAMAGVLLAVALAANAAVALNHPLLVERMDFEHDMRCQMPGFLDQAEANVLTNRGNSRVPGDAVSDGHRGDPARGWQYLLYGWWLVPLGAAGVLFGARGQLPRRLAVLSAWAGAGLALAVAVCLPRLRAEYHWLRARIEESRGRYLEAREHLDWAAYEMPDFRVMERSWLLAGRIAFAQGRGSPQAWYFRIHQLEPRERPRARDMLRELAPSPKYARPEPVSREYARVYTEAGLGVFRQAGRAVPQDAWRKGRSFFEAPGFYPPRLVAAQGYWKAAAAALDQNHSAPQLYVGETAARLDARRPDRVREWLGPFLDRLPDRVLRADAQVTLGDAYFHAGDFAAARGWYRESIKSFMLPKIINYRAQKGLGGL